MNTNTNLLENVDILRGTHYALKETALDLFEFGASMTLQHASDEAQQAYGIVLQYNEEEQLFIQFLQQQERWVLALESIGISPIINRVLALSPSFDPHEQHALRIKQQSEQFVIFVDDSEVLIVNESFRALQPGLFTHNVSVAFTAVQQSSL